MSWRSSSASIATAATAFRPLIREPVFVLRATAAELARTHQRGITRNLRVAIHTAPLFKTTDDVANRDEVAAYEPKHLTSLGSVSTPTARPSTRRTGSLNFFGQSASADYCQLRNEYRQLGDWIVAFTLPPVTWPVMVTTPLFIRAIALKAPFGSMRPTRVVSKRGTYLNRTRPREMLSG